MHQRRKRLGGRPAGEVGRVQGDFVRHLLRVVEAGETVAGKIAVGSLVPLHGDQARRELAAEQLAVEMVIGGVKAGIGACVGWAIMGAVLSCCIVRYNLCRGRGAFGRIHADRLSPSVRQRALASLRQASSP